MLYFSLNTLKYTRIALNHLCGKNNTTFSFTPIHKDHKGEYKTQNDQITDQFGHETQCPQSPTLPSAPAPPLEYSPLHVLESFAFRVSKGVITPTYNNFQHFKT